MNTNTNFQNFQKAWTSMVITVVKLMIDLRCHAQKMFQMILLSVTKTFQNMLVLEISNKGFMVNQHSKSLAKPESELQFPIALQQDIFS